MNMTPDKLRAIAEALDIYDAFVQSVKAEFPDLRWENFPFDDSDLSDTEMQDELREFADQLEAE
jgi:hypothetical protein